MNIRTSKDQALRALAIPASLAVAWLLAGPEAQAQNAAAQAGEAKAESGYTRNTRCTTEELDINADCRRTDPTAVKKAPKEAAPIDLTGTWVSMIVEEWRWRMMTPPKGDVASLPLNDAAKKVVNAWDPESPDSCKAFGAAGLIRNPMRIRISWTDDQTMKFETDHGSQTRTFHFDASKLPGGAPSMQGESAASWDNSGLKVVTTHLAPGFLRKNGVPYSDKTKLTEYFHRYSAFGDDYITVLTVVNDPVYLTRELILTTDFKRLKDDSEWHPTSCESELGWTGAKSASRAPASRTK